MTNQRISQLTKRLMATALCLLSCVGPIAGQRPAATGTAALNEPPFEELVAADAYKLYGEIRNVGQLLTGAGAGEIIDPIIKLADPGREFKSIISFLQKNSEALESSRLMFATWRARTDVPDVLVAIEFATPEDARKFAPRIETFLPTILPPPPSSESRKSDEPPAISSPEPKASQTANKPAISQAAAATATPQPRQLPFVITRAGRLVFISDKAFKLERLRPAASQALFYEPNFRTAHDKFSTEPLFFFFNVALEDQTKPKPAPTPVISEEERERRQREEEAEIERQIEEARAMKNKTSASPDEVANTPVLVVAPPAPTPSKEQQAQIVAGKQIEGLLDAIGFGEPQWPEAVGLAVELTGSEYALRALLIDKPETKRRPIPFVPQLLAGPPTATEVATILPDDTEVFVSASIDFVQTWDGMRKAAADKAKTSRLNAVYKNGVLVQAAGNGPQPDPFTDFEKKADFNVREELISALGNEIALAGSLNLVKGAGGFNFGVRSSSGSGSGIAANRTDKPDEPREPEPGFPALLIEIRDRDAVRRVMPKVLNGLGLGEANVLAQTERRGDTEMVNYAGIFAYGFVGNFMVISDAVAVRRVIEANLNNQTLSTNAVFRNSRRWQSNRTLGQIYVSPALMAGYHEDIRRNAGAMDDAMRDFLLALDPRSEAITYALSGEGAGALHELRLPKNLILTMVAGISSAARNQPSEPGEATAVGLLYYLASMETQYQQGAGKGSYGSLQQLTEAKLLQPAFLDQFEYRFELVTAGDGFEAVATPKEYGKSGKRSFFVDKSGIVRGADHGGAPASLADPPVRP